MGEIWKISVWFDKKNFFPGDLNEFQNTDNYSLTSAKLTDLPVQFFPILYCKIGEIAKNPGYVLGWVPADLALH